MSEQPDIVKRLTAYAEVSDALGAYTEANCAYDAIDEIERLRRQIVQLTCAFRVNMMMNCSEYTHEEFDRRIAELLAPT